MRNEIQMMNSMVFSLHYRRHKGKTALEMASKTLNLQTLLEQHTAINNPMQVNGNTNGSVSPLLKRCSFSNRGENICKECCYAFTYLWAEFQLSSCYPVSVSTFIQSSLEIVEDFCLYHFYLQPIPNVNTSICEAISCFEKLQLFHLKQK